MNKTKIEWCDSTWNPVTGCLHGCEYCYARKIAGRFGTQLPDHSGYPEAHGGLHCLESKIEGNPYSYLFEPTFLPFRLKEPEQKTKPQTIFVCSMADLFGDWVPDEWIEEVFKACQRAPQHRYLFLTKNPKRYAILAVAGKLPSKDNMWYGSTVTGKGEAVWAGGPSWNSFISVEPLLGPIGASLSDFDGIEWVIIGAETGNRKGKVVPRKEWIDQIREAADSFNVSVFMKDSLIPILGEENMRREFPWSGKEH